MPSYAVILPAAGKSSRFGGKQKKPFLTLDGRAVWIRTAELFVTRKDITGMFIAIAPEDRETFAQRYGANLAFMDVRVVDGGRERFESVANALAAAGDGAEFIAVHDAVRPCTSPELIDAVFAAAARHGAAIPAVPVPDTVKRVGKEQFVEETLSRENLWLAQTPQVFRRDWLADAYARRAQLKGPITDDAQLVEAAGHRVKVVPGEPTNIKITTPADLKLAESILRAAAAAKPPPVSRHPFADEQF